MHGHRRALRCGGPEVCMHMCDTGVLISMPAPGHKISPKSSRLCRVGRYRTVATDCAQRQTSRSAAAAARQEANDKQQARQVSTSCEPLRQTCNTCELAPCALPNVASAITPFWRGDDGSSVFSIVCQRWPHRCKVLISRCCGTFRKLWTAQGESLS